MTARIWENVPIAFFKLPSCPHCGSPQRITVRSSRESDGSTARRTICKRCSGRYTLVLELDEPPEVGSEASRAV
jgi:transcriptional regulator NrdR family protein